MIVLAGVTWVASDKVGRGVGEADSHETNEVPVAAVTVLTWDSGTFYDWSNAYGGVRVSGYLTGVLGVCTAAMSTYVSSVWGGCCGAVSSRTGGGEVIVSVAEASRVPWHKVLLWCPDLIALVGLIGVG